MSLFGKRETSAERRERSAAERERARLEREARRAGKPLPAPEPEPVEPPRPEPPRAPVAERGGSSAPEVDDPPTFEPPPPPVAERGGSSAPEVDDPPRTELPPAPEPEPEPEPVAEDSWFSTSARRQTAAAPPPPAPPPPVAPRPAPGSAPAEQPIGVRRAGAPTVRDLPQVAGPRPPRRGTPKQRRGARRVVGVVLLLVMAAIAWFLVSLLQPFAGDGEGAVRVTVPQGSDPGAIGDLLAEEGVVGSSFFFELRARISGDSSNLRAGTFTLKEDMSYGAALDALTTAPPPPKVLKVTVPEGRARTEIVPLLEGSGLRGSYLKASDARRSVLRRYGAPSDTPSLEGFLYPATYELKVGASARDLVGKQLDAFEEVARRLKLRSRAKRLDLDGYQVLSIASMIEREVIVPKERRLVSAVIHNRLEQGIPLGIDATIRYRLRNWDRPLRQSELEIDSGYNTRTRQGLPPTPIGNPGEEAIEAALTPAKVDHLFYVVKPCGEGAHAFSSTDAQFQQDVAAYNRARDARGGKDPSNC